jgi:hypothetical protein
VVGLTQGPRNDELKAYCELKGEDYREPLLHPSSSHQHLLAWTPANRTPPGLHKLSHIILTCLRHHCIITKATFTITLLARTNISNSTTLDVIRDVYRAVPAQHEQMLGFKSNGGYAIPFAIPSELEAIGTHSTQLKQADALLSTPNGTAAAWLVAGEQGPWRNSDNQPVLAALKDVVVMNVALNADGARLGTAPSLVFRYGCMELHELLASTSEPRSEA